MMNLEHAKITSYKPKTEATTDIASKQHTSSNLLAEAVNYWLSEVLIFAHAIACVEIILLRSDKANAIYREIVQAWGLSGCQDIVEATLPYMPNSAELFIDSIRLNKKNTLPQAADTLPQVADTLPQVADTLPQAADTLPQVADTLPQAALKLWFQSDTLEQMSEHPHYQYLVKRINELILVGFNRKIDQDNKKWKVTPGTSPYLLILAISLRSAAEYYKIRLQDLIQIKVQVNDKLHDFDYKIPRNPSTRKERSIRSVLIKAFKHDDFVLRHDTKLLKYADQWYKCRVNPGTIEAYLDELASRNIYIDRGRLENDIAPCDEATGYPRKWRK